MTVALHYADGEEMPFAEVRVFSPTDDVVPVQHGRSDVRGRMAFVPDRDGTWTVLASDGEGHGVRAAIPVSLGQRGAPAPVERAPLALRLLLIGSVLANIGLALSCWRLAARRPGGVRRAA